MRYVLAVLLPPIAVLSCGKVFQAILNVLLLPFVWIPAVVHALFVVHNYHADVRADRMIYAMRRYGAIV